ncbi:MAG: cytochrome bc complex cytochrome b subunit [Anaerolineales bacterium]|nr:cytochrome bc complex cytochrome b subunit [Anaerolineales bacterium]
MYIPGMGFWQNLTQKGVKQAVSDKIDETTRAVLAGIGPKELRALLRGDPPTEKPNPRYRAQVKSFMLHIRPKFYQEGSTWLTHTFRLGLFSTLLFIIETITGLILMVYYTPSPTVAYYDMLNILSNVNFGKFLRDFHRLGAELMVIAVTLHMVRVYFTGSYKHPRQFTWLTGMVLLLLTLFLSFSGYLLPWDQLALWAVTIGTSMAEAAPLIGYQVNLILRGSQDIGAGGLLRFYLLHVFMLPLLTIIFISIHYYKVSREHSISLPAVIEEGEAPPEQVAAAKRKIDLIPDLITSEIMWSAVLIAGMIIYMVFGYSAVLEHHADPLKTPLHTTAPWYFLWLQGMLKLGEKTLWGVVIPTIIFLVLFAVPYIDPGPSRLAKNRKVGITVGLLTSVFMVVLTYMGTGLWGVAAPPPVELIQEFIPEEGVGEVREIPYEQLVVGNYTASDSATYPSGRLGEILAEMKEAVDRESEKEDNNFYNGDITLAVEDWQTDLKKLTITVWWDEVPEGGTELEPRTYEKLFFIHRESGYHLLESKF